MSRLIGVRRRRWTRPRAYPLSARRTGRRGGSWKQAWNETRPFILLLFLCAGLAVWWEPALVRAPDFLSAEPQLVEGRWQKCAGGWHRHCVVDGDTFYIGRDRYRIIGLDTPETDARCEAEARLAERATRDLIGWMNAGPFFVQGRLDEPEDRYGRALRELYRVNEYGMREYASVALVEAGVAREYGGGSRAEWC